MDFFTLIFLIAVVVACDILERKMNDDESK